MGVFRLMTGYIADIDEMEPLSMAVFQASSRVATGVGERLLSL